MRLLYSVRQLCSNFQKRLLQIYHNSTIIIVAVSNYLLTLRHFVFIKNPLSSVSGSTACPVVNYHGVGYRTDKLKAESERLKAIGQPSKMQLTNRLPQPTSHKADASGFAMTEDEEGFLKLKAEGERLKAVGQLSKEQITQGLPPRSITESDASLIAMTRLWEGVQVNGSIPLDKIINNSNDPSLTENSALAVAVAIKKFLHFHCSNWRSGGFFWLLFSATGKKLLALRGYEREDFNSNKKSKNTDKTEPSQKLLTNRLPQPASHKADASGFAMTVSVEAVLLNRSALTNSSILVSNNPSLTENSALAVAVAIKKFLHFHCSNWRSGGFFWLLFSATGKKLLALRGYEREDFNSNKKSKNTDKAEPSQEQLTNRLSQPTSHKADASGFAMTLKRKSISVKIRPNLLMFLLIVLITIGSKRTKAQSKALQIGDTIPAAVWNIPLTLLNQADGKNTLSLRDYKGKVILLNFWSSYCGSCIANMPHIRNLQESLKDSLLLLPINSESKERIEKVWSINPHLKKLPIYTVYEDEQLKKLFPHQLFPHLVWINREGKYIGATLVEYANAETVSTIWKGEQPKWAIKNDEDLFDPQKISLHAYFKVDTAQHFLPYLKGVKSQSRILIAADSSIRYFAVNTRMVNQYAIATACKGLAFEPKRRVLELPDSKAFEYQKSEGYAADWEAKYAYCYERYFPKGTTTLQIHQQLLKDLNAHFNLEGRIEEMPTDVLLLAKSVNPSLPSPLLASGIKLMSWLAQVNRISALPWILNNEGLNTKLMMPSLPANLTLAAIQKSLLPYGLQLKPAKVNLPTFHLTPKSTP